MHWKRWLVILLILAGVGAALFYGYRPQPLAVETEKVRLGPLRITVDEEGKTRITDTYVVSAPVAGYARRIRLKVGDPVEQGQTIVMIDAPRATALDPRSRAEAQARVAVAEAALDAARQRIGAAEADTSWWKSELARVEKLVRSGDIPRDRLDRTQSEERRASATLREATEQVRVAQSEVLAARAALEFERHPVTDGVAASQSVPVHADVGGRVLRVLHESEGVVQPGEPLVEIANARSLEVVVELLSADAVKVAPGTRVIFTRWGGDKPLQGRVRKIEPVGFTKISALGVEEQRVYVIADITSPREDWHRLGAGYRVEAAFVVWESDNVLLVPSSALFRYGEGWAVFVVEEGFARRRPVQAGHRSGLQAEVLSGLIEGTLVITHPDTEIEDGTLVKTKSFSK
jgi:HlyD family secretion protein